VTLTHHEIATRLTGGTKNPTDFKIYSEDVWHTYRNEFEGQQQLGAAVT